jgi:hypothetical protein
MDIFIISARHNGVNISSNAEIGIFDGSLCVGAASFTKVVSQATPLKVIATKDDGTGNGFIDGHEIIFKLWDATSQQEFTLTNGNVQFYDTNTGSPITAVVFMGLETAAVSLSATSSAVTQFSHSAELPEQFSLDQNYPNPFNPLTKISYALPEPTVVKLEIFDLKGNHVNTLVDEPQAEGYFIITWDGRDADGNALASGVYFYKLTAQSFVQTKKMMLVR